MKRTNSKEAYELIVKEHIQKLQPEKTILIKLFKAKRKKNEGFSQAAYNLVDMGYFANNTQEVREFIKLLRKNGIKVGKNNLTDGTKMWDWYSELVSKTLKKYFKSSEKIDFSEKKANKNSFENKILRKINVEKLNSKLDEDGTFKGRCLSTVGDEIIKKALEIANGMGLNFNGTPIIFKKGYVYNENSTSTRKNKIKFLLNGEEISSIDFNFKVSLKQAEKKTHTWDTTKYLIKKAKPITTTNIEREVEKYFENFSKEIIQRRNAFQEQRKSAIKELEETLEKLKNENYSDLATHRSHISTELKYLLKYKDFYTKDIKKMKAMRESK